MIDIDYVWQKASRNEEISTTEIQALINDRISAVSEQLHTISQSSRDETLFDLMMLVFDSLTEKREAILSLWNNSFLNTEVVCEGQAQLLSAIDRWHEVLNLHWSNASYLQNLLFLCALIYAAAIWKNDSSPDNSKVMARVDELIGWLNSCKSSPFDIFEKIKNAVIR